MNKRAIAMQKPKIWLNAVRWCKVLHIKGACNRSLKGRARDAGEGVSTGRPNAEGDRVKAMRERAGRAEGKRCDI